MILLPLMRLPTLPSFPLQGGEAFSRSLVSERRGLAGGCTPAINPR